MEKQKYVKPSAISLDDVSSALGATCTVNGQGGSSVPACKDGPGDSNPGGCGQGPAAGIPGSCHTGPGAQACFSGSSPTLYGG
jgi:hypothetical protein